MLEAVSNNNLEEVKRLLKKGCAVNEPDYDGRTPLHIAASNNNKAIVETLLKVKYINVNPVDNFEMTPFHDAVVNKHKEVARLLKIYNGVIIHRDVGYKLCQAGFRGDLPSLEQLKSNGASVNTADYDLRTALHLAACEGHENCVRWLLDEGANLNVKDVFKKTPLDDAERFGHPKIATMLRGFTERERSSSVGSGVELVHPEERSLLRK